MQENAKLEIKYCKRCVMNDMADRTIVFDKNGYCNYCSKALSEINTTTYFPNEIGKAKLEEMLSRVKSKNKKQAI